MACHEIVVALGERVCSNAGMAKINFGALVDVRLKAPQGVARIGGLQGVPLAHAIRTIMEDWGPGQKALALIDIGRRTIGRAEIEAIYSRSDFPGS